MEAPRRDTHLPCPLRRNGADHSIEEARMDPIASYAERTLRRSPHPALRMSELLESVSERLDRALDAGRLRAILEGHPEHFRILDPWKGPWRSVNGALLAKEGAEEVWVVAVGDPDGPPDDAGPATVALRESVRWLVRGLDSRSPADVSRWYAIAMSERAVRAAVVRRAA
jgi:hypothetical protein